MITVALLKNGLPSDDDAQVNAGSSNSSNNNCFTLKFHMIHASPKIDSSFESMLDSKAHYSAIVGIELCVLRSSLGLQMSKVSEPLPMKIVTLSGGSTVQARTQVITPYSRLHHEYLHI